MKKEIIEALLELWEKYPNMRLGQLLDWIAGGDAFYISNINLLNAIKEKLKD